MNKWNYANLCTPQKQVSHPGRLLILGYTYSKNALNRKNVPDLFETMPHNLQKLVDHTMQ